MKNYKLLEHKVGIKILDESTLENIFPMYQSMMNKINECRCAASEPSGWQGKRHYQYNFMYDNVFSILGKRGTGKTSVAFSLKEIIEKNAKNTKDVVLPIIIPEVIPENCTILGWLLAIIKEEVEDLEYQIKEQKITNCGRNEDYWDNCRYSDEIVNLSEKLKQLSRMVFAGKYNPANENSYYKAIGNSEAQAEDYYQFANEIAEFWNMWIKTIQGFKMQNASGDNTKKSPLIYFIFDDVDLSPEKIGELLSVIIKYLSHPNLIVITTADEQLFLDVLENRLDKSIGRLPKEWRAYLSKKAPEGIIYYTNKEPDKLDRTDLVGETARMYLGKVMPPSMRYYLRTFNTASQKAHFLMDDKQVLGESVREQIEKIISYTSKEKKQACFMGNKGQVNNFYLNYFGNTSRQIGNIYIGIRSLVDNLVDEIKKVKKGKGKKEVYLSKVYETCRYFISLVIHTNHNLGNIIDPVDKFVDGIFMPEYRRQRLYVNYTYIAVFLENYYKDNDVQESFDTRIQLYSLVAFVENILLLLESCTNYGITGRKSIHLVKPFAEYLNGYVFGGRYVFRDDFNENQFFGHYGLLLDHLDGILDNMDSDKMLDVEYFYNFCSGLNDESGIGFSDMVVMYQENQGWFREITGMIAMVYGGAYLVNWELIENIIPFWSENSIMSYQVYADHSLNENIKTYMEVFNLYKYAEKNISSAILLDCQYNEHNYEDYKLQVKNDLLERLKEQNKDEYDSIYKSFIPLATVLKYIEDMHDKPEDIIKHCPKEVLDRLYEILNIWIDEKDVQELLQKEIMQIEEEGITEQVGFYFPYKWMVVLDELRNNENPAVRRKARVIHQMIGWVFDEEIITEDTEQIIVKYKAADLLKLRSLFDELLDDIYMEEELEQSVQELFNDLDFVVDLDNLAEVGRAVNIGSHLLVAGYLQKLYLSLNIKAGYERGGYFSPGNIQWIPGAENKRKTYYYQLFEIMEKTEDGTLKVSSGQKRNKEELRHLIRRITRNQRRKYIDRIQRER